MQDQSSRYDLLVEQYTAIAMRMVHFDIFGDTLAKREGYKKLRGIEAVHYYLVHKFNWTPSVVRSLTYDDLSLLLAEDMSGWTLPEEFRAHSRQDTDPR